MANPIDVFSGKSLRRECLKAGFSKVAMAERIGVKYQQLQKFDNAKNRVSRARLWPAAQALGVPVSTFFPPVDLGATWPSDAESGD
ncbi:helix-turn-helix domain-containing protein [Maritimibacter sp. DP07]|uniref:Helix-turn-helix domain-containing protein n=1 Tax=Maritimibacter harenae TaxID=2606218 RepID=A0A845M899_9RHOB|nr:helix-turn-helix transcriptional regulator [Maritimibacter harenae]MZR15399.1 helix-turn-helix domain-containing protein [Maritimibacter harenae]